MKRSVLAGAIAVAGLFASTAMAAVVETTSFVTAPIAANNFETISEGSFPPDAPFSQGGITVQYVSTPGGMSYASTDHLYGNGAREWFVIDSWGYTSIRLDDASAFNQIQFLAASGRGGTTGLEYQLLLGGSVVGTGYAGDLATTAQTYGFSGANFDEIRLQSLYQTNVFDPAGHSDSLALDDIVIGRAVSGGVPEPSTWALMILGFGAAGTALRRRRALAL